MEVNKGVCYGVGVGPGDPELITLKAVRVLTRCPVIAAPQTRSGEMLALDIVRGAVDLAGKTILPLTFTMSQDKAVLQASHEAAADAVQAHLDRGEDVAMPNLGDVSIYATWGYVMQVLEGRGYETVMIPGVPSFCAAAARLNATLVSWGSPLHIIPVGKGPVAPLVEQPGGKVLMKAGRGLSEIAQALGRTGQLDRAALVEDCGLPTERVWTDWDRLPQDVGYFATVIVKEES
ncbi:MAG: precorrin-2 C(20)-methyltransferase [Oscillospiraceae bacterium]|nr:precorrin-2 C(20)-methyltransferase [Oscillospiraceae bacterium]